MNLARNSDFCSVFYPYGYNGEESVDEVSGEKNSYDYGNRFYNPRIGKFLSLDAYAIKYPSVSPYAFAVNSPISNRDVGGDSVLFYSQSGEYLVFSHDNQRYKGKNLLVVIDDNSVKTFKEQYLKKTAGRRDDDKSNDVYTEAITAGLEAMGTAFVISDVSNFIRKYSFLLGTDKDHTTKSEWKYSSENNKLEIKQQEWGAWMVLKENPVVKGLKNWIAIDEESIVPQGAYCEIPNRNGDKNKKSWVHLHTYGSSLATASAIDRGSFIGKRQSSVNDDYSFFVGGFRKDDKTTKITNLFIGFYSKTNTEIFDSNDYKEAKEPAYVSTGQ